MKWTIALALVCALLASCRGGGEHAAQTADQPMAENQVAVAAALGENPTEGAADAYDDSSPQGGPGDPEPSQAAPSDEVVEGAGPGGLSGGVVKSETATLAPSVPGTSEEPPPDDELEIPAQPVPADLGQERAAAQDGVEPTIRPPGWTPEDSSSHPLAIERLRGLSYPGSDLIVVEELPAGSNYSRAVATYESEGLTIRGLLTVPNGEQPPLGWPVIVFNHGYIPPAQYRTTERYVAYQDAFARNGYITFKSDYRGHGNSEGESASSRGSPAYTTDVLNAMTSVARHPAADANRIGMWGHSMGGSITLRSMVVSDRIRAGVIWAGVVASYPDLYNRIGRGSPSSSATSGTWRHRGWRSDLVGRFGTPEENPAAWAAVSPNSYLADISGPLQLHHGTADHSVPVEYSVRLQEQMDAAGMQSELLIYDGDDHNLAGSLSTALARSVAFFDRHVKGEG